MGRKGSGCARRCRSSGESCSRRRARCLVAPTWALREAGRLLLLLLHPASRPPAGLPSSFLLPLVPLSVRLVRLRPSGLQVGDIGKVILL